VSKLHDVVVIGGGPGGSAAATYLARSGQRVLLLEKERFPRFKIGESLLPYSRAILEELGVWPRLQGRGFPVKRGAQFHLGDGSKSLKFVFAEGRFTRHTEILQVERAIFDEVLLNHAAACGVQVLQGWTVNRFTTQPDGVGVHATPAAGESVEFRGRYLIDASGRANVTGNQEALRADHPRHRKLAVFGHFHGVMRDDAPTDGDILIVRLANKWFWLIPISPDKTSVGCVMEKDEFVAAKESPGDIFHRVVRSSAALHERMADARLVGAMQTTTDFSYFNRRLVGPRLLRVGDAAGFMDPIFSAGVHLALWSGKLASEVVHQSLIDERAFHALARRFERRVFSGLKKYWELVEYFYTTPFLEVFMEPRPKWGIAAAVNAMLAGDLEGGWRLWWRLRAFYWLVRWQAKRPFMPRITFE
jgi:FADH2-dependent halogenase